jgi:EpsI family protein
VLGIGWRWFDRDPDAAWFDPAALQSMPRRRVDASIASLLALAIACLFLGWSSLIAARTAPLPVAIALPDIPGWQRAPMSSTAPWQPNFPNADHFLMGRYVDAGARAVDLAVAVYGSQHEGKELVGFGIGAIRENDRWVRIEEMAPVDGGAALRMTGPGRVEREVVTWYRVGDTLTGSANRVKLETLRVRLLGGEPRAVAVLVSAERGRGQDADAAIRAFLASLGRVDGFADRMSGAR